MSGTGSVHELNAVFAVLDLLFVAIILAQISILSARLWRGQVVPDTSGWQPRQSLDDRRFRLGLGIGLVAAWASIAIALIRHALEPGVMPLLASNLGPLPIAPWLALVLQHGHRLGLWFALWATGLWLERSISNRWSLQQASRRGGRSFLAMLLVFSALFLSLTN